MPQGASSANTTPGTPSGAYLLNGFESVNPFSGKVNFSMPLFKIGGRGSAGYPINLTIERNWTITHDVNDPNFYQESSELYPITHRYTPDDGTGFVGNQSTSTMPGFIGVLRGNRIGRNHLYNLCDNLPCYDITLTTLTFIQPDGTETNFRDVLKSGKATASYDTNLSRGTDWVSTDASGTTFKSDTTISDIRLKGQMQDGFFYPSGVLTLPNGTKYRVQNGQVTEITDVNGNKVDLNTDSLGREYTSSINYNPSPTVDFERVFNLKGINGANRPLKINYSHLQHSLSSGFALTDLWELFSIFRPEGMPNSPYNPVVASSVVFSDNSRYEFRYNNFGELTEIIMPTGGRIEYVWQSAPGVFGTQEEPTVTPASRVPPDDKPNLKVYRRVEKRRIYENNQLQNETIYSQPVYLADNTSLVTVDTYAKENNTLVLKSKSKHYYFGQAVPDLSLGYSPYEQTYLYGRELRTEVYDSTGTNIVQRKLQNWYQTPPSWWTESAATAPSNDTRLGGTVSITFENGKALATLSKSVFDESGHSDPSYFSHLNVKRTESYHYKSLDFNSAKTADFQTIAALFTTADLASVSETDYSYNADYKNRGILGLTTETRVLNPSNPSDILSKTQSKYDEAAYPLIDPGSATGYETPTGANAELRGNVTTTRTWVKETDTWLETHAQYDKFGNQRKAWDISGDPSRFTETEYSADYQYAYPTKVITPAPSDGVHGTNQGTWSETTYDFDTGLTLTTKNEFGQIVATEYDSNLRPIRVYGQNYATPETQTIYGQPDSSGQLPANQRFIKVRKQVDETNWDEAVTWLDSLGRTVLTTATDSQGEISTQTKYDSLGRIEMVTSPYRQNDPIYWSKTRYDELGRAVETFAPTTDPVNNPGTSNGLTSFDISTVSGYVGTVVTTKDASGRKSRSITNALGQLIRVDEATATGGTADADLGTLASPNQPTYYKYDVYGKMVKVQQGVQSRYFQYDSLGRMIRVRQPEQQVNTNLPATPSVENNTQWTAGSIYDIFGNVIRTTDANGTNTISEYDKANRIIRRCYTKPNIVTTATKCDQLSSGQNGQLSVTTPPVEYFYDGYGLDTVPPATNNYAKGKLTKVASSISETRYTTFDQFGRLLQSQQITDGRTFTSGYQYDFGGRLVEETYPSGRVVKNLFEADGDLLKVESRKITADVFRTFVSNFSYTASGGISQMRLGNGRWETAKFNNRQQVTELGLGTSAADTSLWKVAYGYGELDDNGNVDQTKNTGNIAKQTVSFNGLAQPFVQTYKYDSLYRITEAKETSNNQTNWTQGWSYDRYGNRIGFTQNINGVTSNLTPTVDANTNRFTAGQGFVYDKNGNITADVDYTETRSFTFNGDNKQVEILKNGAVIGKYFYDGEGKRVKKTTNLETTIFVYSSGKLVAEYSTKLANNPSTNYVTTDHLGSPRVITNELGQIKSRRDFLPFGEELGENVGSRTSALKYGAADEVRQRFTGYQKDTETGLDFVEARMYHNQHGRFTAVDPLLASGRSDNPQTFNRYNYVVNNPIVLIDEKGLYPVYFLDRNGSRTYSIVKKTKEWQRYEGPEDKFISVAEDLTKGKLISVTKNRITVHSFSFGSDENAKRSAENFNELDSNQKKLIASLAMNSSQKGKLVAVLAGGAVLVGTGVGFYLYAAGATTGTLINLGIAGQEFAKRNPQTVQQLGDFLAKPAPQGLILNLGGNVSDKAANNIVNINSLVNSTSRSGSEIPNLIQGNASNIQKLFESSQWAGQKVGVIQSSNFTGVNMDWNRFAQGAYNILEKNGQIRLGLHGISAETINNTIIPALRNAGFTNVNVYNNTFVTGLR
ncbi:MAG: hypothetical protein LUM44_11245 [Pyrinomonadaceae bacterium]|nr:hypothetical protein [Pyrinomonadaceae bacterium]